MTWKTLMTMTAQEMRTYAAVLALKTRITGAAPAKPLRQVDDRPVHLSDSAPILAVTRIPAASASTIPADNAQSRRLAKRAAQRRWIIDGMVVNWSPFNAAAADAHARRD